jgi:ATP-dependent protease ClpP protease subunit
MRPLTLDIYDEISVNAVSSKDVLLALGPAKNAKEILIRMNSPGGEVTEGLAIHNMILEQRRSGLTVRCRIDGMCASIATVIACAADTVEMAENAFYCVHFPMSGGGLAGARSDELRERADLLDSMTRLIVPVYVAKTGMSEDEVRKLMESDKLISAQEALDLGFVDKLIPSNLKAVASIRIDRLPQYLATQVPEALRKAKAKMDELEDMKATIAELKDMCTKMAEDFASFKAGKAPDEGDAPAEEEPTEGDGDEPEAKATASILKTAMALAGVKDPKKLEPALMAMQARAQSTALTSHAANVEKAFKSGRVLPHMKARALKMTPDAFADYLDMLGNTKLAPIGEEHEPEPEQAAALAAAVAKKKIDPAKIEISHDELELARRLAPGGSDPVAYARMIKAS